jgi:4-amino-4-deoxy-L-arabinose transferase-like glycosyltransferase
VSKRHLLFLVGLAGVALSPFLFDPLARLIQNHGPSWATVKITRVHHLTFWCLSFIWAIYFSFWVWKSDWSWFSAGNLKRKFFLILAAGTLFRLAVILFANAPQVSDARDYDQMALALAQTGIFQDNGVITVYRPIGYVAFLAGLYKFFGHTLLLPQLANVILDICTLLLLWRLFSRWKDEKTALAACAILAFYLPEVYSTQYLLSEQLFVFLWIFCIYLFDLYREKRLPAFLSGLCFGLAALVRPVVLLWAIIPAVAEAARRHWRRLAFFCFAVILAITPWLYRNYKQFGVWKLSTNSGINFWMGANPQATGYYYMPPAPPFDFKDEVETERQAWQLGWKFVKENPLDYLRLGLIKEAMIFGFDYGYILPGLTEKPSYGQLVWAILGQAMWWVIFFFGGVKVALILFDSRKRGAAGSFLPLWTLFYWAAVHFFFIGVDRYHHPVVPFFAYLAVLPVWTKPNGK